MITIELDAQGKVLGRFATTIANALRGKDRADFRQDRLPGIRVVVANADKVVVTGTKETGKTYYRFSGYPGGLKRESLAHLRKRKPERILYEAVRRMLPKNRLQARLLKQLELHVSPKV